MLVGAFFQINFDNFSLTAASQRRLEAQMAAESGLTYARYKLEMDQSWGPPFSGPPVVLGPLRVKVKSNTELLGEFADGRSFSLQVVNQLNQAAPVLPALPTGVPKDAVKVTVRGYSQAFTSGVELLMVGEPLYDAAATSNGVLNMIGNKTWEIHSRDKIRNWIRSNDAIYANDVLSGGNITKFKSDVGSAVPGIMWSKKDIYNQNTLLDASNLNNFNSAVNGVAAARSTMNNNIYNLKVDDLKVPTTSIAMRPGRYVVSESSVIPINEETRGRWPFTRTVNVDQPAQPVRAIAFYPDGGGAPQVTIPRSEMLRVAGSASPPYQPPPAVIAPSDTIILDPAGGANFVYEFGTGDFKISGDQQYTVAGNFTIGYDETPPTGLGPKLPKPDTDIIISTVTNPTFLNVTNNFVIDGKVKGRGAVAAGKEVVMRADADLSASVTDPLVFYGGGNVTIDATGRQNVKFTGLVYANNDFKIKDTASPSTLDEVRLHGALVARNGRIDITAANAVTMTYDPAFVENLTKGLPDNHRRLKPMSWRQL
ncbi:hypothetical protein IV102_02300 [bacterium]|nr:hypothetical protein [bacterium]